MAFVKLVILSGKIKGLPCLSKGGWWSELLLMLQGVIWIFDRVDVVGGGTKIGLKWLLKLDVNLGFKCFSPPLASNFFSLSSQMFHLYL